MAHPDAPRCPSCGSRLPASQLHGNCASCLLALAVGGAAADFDASPSHVGGYELVGEIARGGMGIVYRARQAGLARDVALKLIQSGRLIRPEQVQRFYTEARAVARLDHPNIVPVHEAGEDEGRHFIAMKLLEGGTLAARMASLPPTGTPERLRTVATLVTKISRAVHFAHQHGVLHRDLKPANILFDTVGEPHVADFGLARLTDEDSGLTHSFTILGTPDYLAPEVARGGAAKATVASDVFSLGAILYELLCGQPPFSAATPLETLRRASEETAIAPSRMNTSASAARYLPSRNARLLDTLCLKCLSREPRGRYGSAAELADDLDRWLDGRAILARPETWAERLVRACRRNPAMASVLGVLAGVVVAGVSVAIAQDRSNRRDLYAADLHIASEAVRDGDLGLARTLLELHRAPTNDFAWRLLRRQSDGDPMRPVDRHPWIVNAVAWSPDGRYLLSGSVGSGTVGDEVHLVDIRDGTPTRSFGSHGARCLAWFPDGRRFLSANVDGRIRIWNRESGTVIQEFPGLAAALSTNGTVLVTSERDPFPWGGANPGRTFLRRLSPELEPLPLPDSRVVAVSPDGRRVAVSDANTVITVHEGATGRLLRTLSSGGPLWALEFSPDGTQLVATGWNPDIRLWKLDPGSPEPVRWKGHSLSTWKVAFSPDGRQLVSTSSDQTLGWWDVGSGTSLGHFRGHGSEVWCAAFSPDGRSLASGGKDQLVALWPAVPPDRARPLPHEHPLRPVFSADGLELVTITSPAGNTESQVHRLGSGSPAQVGLHGSPLAIAADGRWLVHEKPGRLIWIDPKSASATQTVDLETADGPIPYIQAAVSPDTSLFAGTAPDGLCRVWDTRTGRQVARFSFPPFITVELAFSPDDRWLAIAGEEHGAWICPISSGTPRRLTNHLDQVRAVAFSPDSQWLATASVDATVHLRRLPSAETIAILRGHRTTVDSVAFSPDGRILASLETGESVRLWHLPTRREAARIPVTNALDWLRFSPDGQHLGVLTSAGVRLLDAR